MDISNFDEVFEKKQYSAKTENSFRELSNWLLAISTGICALLIFEIRSFDFSKCIYIRHLYKGILIFSMSNTFLTGFSKYFIFKRDIAMSIKYGSLKKLVVFSEIDKSKPEDNKNEWTKLFEEWSIEYNKIKCVGTLLNLSIITTLITIIAVGIFIVTII